jgi:hypothetical protein
VLSLMCAMAWFGTIFAACVVFEMLGQVLDPTHVSDITPITAARSLLLSLHRASDPEMCVTILVILTCALVGVAVGNSL